MFFDDVKTPTPFREKRKRFDGALRRLNYAPKKREFSADPFAEFLPGDEVVCDTEVYKNYFLAMFKHLATGKYFFLEQRGYGPFLYGDLLSRALFYFKVITFNGVNYDGPIMKLATDGADTLLLKETSDEMIKEGKRNYYKIPYNHIDLIEVAPLPDTSLKTYGARMHTKRLQELPIPEDAELSEEDMNAIFDYCGNDCDVTHELFEENRGDIELREAMSAEYKTDLRSKSDAQVAEAVICAELKKLTGYWPKKPTFDEQFSFQYAPPSYVGFQTPALQEVLRTVCNARFELDAGGSPQMPEALSNLKIMIGKNLYKMGMGGLHSAEKKRTYRANEDFAIIDRDVESYYPRIILNNSYYPEHLGPQFLTVFGSLVDRRLDAKGKVKEAKKAGDKAAVAYWSIQADGLKITINGTFGKLGSAYSAIYSPSLLIQTTVTGQLSLMMLIEAIELVGIDVISANTDGIVIYCPRHREGELNAIIEAWEKHCSFKTEETRYKALISASVNSYMAVKESGGDPEARFFDDRMGVKTKNDFCERGSARNSRLAKNPQYLVVNDACVAYVATGKPIEETINECQDVRRFVAVQNVRGGGHQDGLYLGKVCRWYFAEGQFSEINYVGSGNTVGGTAGAKPLMELPDDIPTDVNRRWYIEKAYKRLESAGWFENGTVQASLFN